MIVQASRGRIRGVNKMQYREILTSCPNMESYLRPFATCVFWHERLPAIDLLE